MNKAKISDTGEESVSGTEVAEDSPGTVTPDSGGEEAARADETVDAPPDEHPPSDVDVSTAAESEPQAAEAQANTDDTADVEPSVDDAADVDESADVVADDADETAAADLVDGDETSESDDEEPDLAEDELGESEFEDEDYPESDAAYAHAPTSAQSHLIAEHDYDLGDDRRTEFLWWLLTPLSVLLVAPLIVAGTSFLVALIDTGYPAICQDAAPDNMCEEVVLRMAGQHTIAFGIGWLALWALPWRRRVRPYRIALAILIVLILLAAPLRLLASVDYHA